MNKFEHYDLLKEMVAKRYVSVQKHPTLPLFIYKYSINTPFEKMWNPATLAARGLVLDADGNQINSPIPKFFNIEELPTVGLSLPDLPFRAYKKIDGSLIQAFMYNGEMVFTSSGSFDSIFANVGREIAKEKLYFDEIRYLSEILVLDRGFDAITFIFELLHPNNRIVVNNGDKKDLILLAVRTMDGDFDIHRHDMFRYFNKVESVNLTLEELLKEKSRADFINEEGFVLLYQNGFRVKIKYEEYFRLHKTISNVNEKFVWEFLSSGKKIEDLGENIPDETFQFIKDMKNKIEHEYLKIEVEAHLIALKLRKMFNEKYGDILDINGQMVFDSAIIDKKTFALEVTKPEYKKYASILFKMYDSQPYSHIIWKMVKPKYEKGEGGFQSFKI